MSVCLFSCFSSCHCFAPISLALFFLEIYGIAAGHPVFCSLEKMNEKLSFSSLNCKYLFCILKCLFSISGGKVPYYQSKLLLNIVAKKSSFFWVEDLLPALKIFRARIEPVNLVAGLKSKVTLRKCLCDFFCTKTTYAFFLDPLEYCINTFSLYRLVKDKQNSRSKISFKMLYSIW